MSFIRDTTSSKILEKYIFLNDIESFLQNLILENANGYVFFNNLAKALHIYSKYDNDLFVGDFNTEISDQRVESFVYMHELVKEKTCFKNIQNPSYIDLLLINNVYAFQQTITACTGISDCHKLVLAVLKTTVPRSQSKEITNRDTNNLTLQNLRMS